MRRKPQATRRLSTVQAHRRAVLLLCQAVAVCALLVLGAETIGTYVDIARRIL
ncbi:hypothetical protein [Xanthomonas phage BsXeu269p/3]|nr:hypothetical protein [Xanthomonas phage BsXeu269p/3]